jgi:rod shape-determining protein MreD
MRWLGLVLAAYVLVALETALGGVWALGAVRPALLLVLMVVVALHGRAMVAAWVALCLGVLMDVRWGTPVAGATATLGPWALGMLAGCWAVLQLRHLLFRDAAATVGLMCFVAGVPMVLTAVLLYSVRDLIGPAEAMPGFGAWSRLGVGLATVAYTAAVGLPLGWVLQRMRPWLGVGGTAGR